MEMSKISLRPLRPDDIADINLWPSYRDCYAQMDYALRTNGWLDEYYNKPGAWIYVAEANRGPLGFILLVMTDTTQAEIRIAMHPGKTGQGFGKKIMLTVMEMGFSKLGLDLIHLVVRKNNFPALRLYEKLGFTDRGECTLIIEGMPVHFFRMDIRRENFLIQTRKGAQQ